MGHASQGHRREFYGIDSSGRAPEPGNHLQSAQSAHIGRATCDLNSLLVSEIAAAIVEIQGPWLGTETIEVAFDTGVLLEATGTVTLDTGASGSVDGIEVDSIEIMSGAESFDTDLATTATAIAANITAHTSSPDYNAVAVGAVVTITSVATGYAVNGLVVVSSVTTITTTDTNMVGGVGASQTTGAVAMAGEFAMGSVTLATGASGSVDAITVDAVEIMSGATGTVTLDTGASGSVDGIEVDSIEIMSGAESFVSDLPTTATAVAANITAHTSSPNYSAVAVGAVITITAVADGDTANGLVVVTSVTTITVTDTNMVGVAFDTTLAITATAVALNITNNVSVPNYNAVAVGAVITITAEDGGTGGNGLEVLTSTTTITTTEIDLIGGEAWTPTDAAVIVAAAINGLIDTLAVVVGSRIELTPVAPAATITITAVTVA